MSTYTYGKVPEFLDKGGVLQPISKNGDRGAHSKSAERSRRYRVYSSVRKGAGVVSLWVDPK